MGRKTFESIVGYIGGPLPGRTNIVVTKDSAWTYSAKGGRASGGDGVITAASLEAAIEIAKGLDSERIDIGGGASIYKQALPYIDTLQLTIIDDEKPADTFFPPYEHLFTKKVFEEGHEWNGLRYTWIDLER
jgi:dihydrofolate reductase